MTTGIVMTLLASCGTVDDKHPVQEFPRSATEVAEAALHQERIAEAAGQVVEALLSEAVLHGTQVDPSEVVSGLSDVAGIQQTSLSSHGGTVIVKQDDGTYNNILLSDFTNPDWFEDVVVNSAVDLPHSLTMNPAENPAGKRAVVLVPFSGQLFNSIDVNETVSLLQRVGMSVDLFLHHQATIDKFRADFLEQYDVVYVATHGGVGVTQSGHETTLILSGERVSEAKSASFTEDEMRAIGIATVGGRAYYALTPQWLQETVDTGFHATWLYFNACQSARIDSGTASLAERALALGAGAFSGYDNEIQMAFSGKVSLALITRLLSGQSLADASDAVRTDPDLTQLKWLTRIAIRNEILDVSMLDNHQRLEEPYYLFDPGRSVGNASITPDRGEPGTVALYEVSVSPSFVLRVARMYVTINETAQRFDMIQSNSATWRAPPLEAPTAARYPDTSTFTFTALDSDGKVLGRGSATFTTVRPQVSGLVLPVRPGTIMHDLDWASP